MTHATSEPAPSAASSHDAGASPARFRAAPGSMMRLGRRSLTRGFGSLSGASGANAPLDFRRPQRRDRPVHDQALRPGARQESLREANLMLITEEIFASAEPLSRADLSIRTGMTRSTVSRLVDDLLAAGIVREGSPVSVHTRGRPAVPLSPAPRTLAGLGVEVNVDFTAARALDLTGKVLAEEILEGDHRSSDPEQVLPAAGSMALQVAVQARQLGAQIVGTVLAVPGLVAGDERSLLRAPNLGWHHIDLVDLLCRPEKGQGEGNQRDAEFGGFISAGNEAKLAALAVAQELTVAEGQEQTFLYVSGQMGVGSSVVVDGMVEAGPHGWAGEIGHLTVEPSGPRCGCGATGCLEVYAGKRGLMEAAGLPVHAGVDELLAICQHDDDDGKRAQDAVVRAGEALGVALAGAMNLVDVYEVVLGGEFGPLTHLLRPHIEAQLHQRVLAAQWASVRVREAGAGVAPAVNGGALRALRGVVDAPQLWVPAA
ncbi:ROK family transcriptional regulator [Nesterenkonia flava]|uniref:ROK family transcriptional regulator n=1 Tax=Nesterenkonia flava TaxID=469799 RepID=A0ABU1FUE2_9MICC|nr:ROK family transcriptional regulator [Nesterenkonia flava]MDR5712281.1 ROK family transcriptional regulator [Nesterenkonia flava]